jgi:hypothetical protein
MLSNLPDDVTPANVTMLPLRARGCLTHVE